MSCSRATSPSAAPSSAATAVRSRSSSAMRSWRCGAFRSRTRTTPSGPSAPDSSWWRAWRTWAQDVGAPGLALRVGIVTGEVAVTVGATDRGHGRRRRRQHRRPGAGHRPAGRGLGRRHDALPDGGGHRVRRRRRACPEGQGRALAAARRAGGRATRGGALRIDGLEAPHTGRDREIRLLKELFHATVETRRPRIVVVDGEAGIGKSRLVWEFEKYVDGLSDVTAWHRGRCLSYGDGVAFWALAEAVRTRLGLTEADAGDRGEHPPRRGARRVRPGRARAVRGCDPGSRRLSVPSRPSGLRRARSCSQPGPRSSSGSARATRWARPRDRRRPARRRRRCWTSSTTCSATAQRGIFVLALARPELLARRHDLGGRRKTVIRLEPARRRGHGHARRRARGRPVHHEPERCPRRARGGRPAVRRRDRPGTHRPRRWSSPRTAGTCRPPELSLDVDTMGAPASLQALVAARLDALSPRSDASWPMPACSARVFTRAGLTALPEGDDLDGSSPPCSARRSSASRPTGLRSSTVSSGSSRQSSGRSPTPPCPPRPKGQAPRRGRVPR